MRLGVRSLLFTLGCFTSAFANNDLRFFDYDYMFEPYIRNSRQISNNNYKCQSEGTFYDFGNCRRFYRCVPNENGGYLSYAFECSEGTIYDPAIGVCNYAYASSRLECGANDVAPVKQQPIQTFSTTLAPNLPEGAAESITRSPAPNRCVSAGFRSDSRNCRRFYRCVDNGKQGYTQYEFTCAPGTVFDVNATTCNYPSAVRRLDCTEEADGGSNLNSQFQNQTSDSNKQQQGGSSSSNQQSSSNNNNQSGSSGSNQGSSQSSNNQQQSAGSSANQQGSSGSNSQFESSSSSQQGGSLSNQSSNQGTSSSNNQQQSETSATNQQQSGSSNNQSGSLSSSSQNNNQGSSSNNNQQQSGGSSSNQQGSSSTNNQSGSSGSSQQSGTSTSNQNNNQGSSSNNNQQQSGSSSANQESSGSSNTQSGSSSQQGGSSTSSNQGSSSSTNQSGSSGSSQQSAGSTLNQNHNQGSSSNNNQQQSGSSTSSQQGSSNSNSNSQSGNSASSQESGAATSNQGSSSNNSQQQSGSSSSNQQSSGNNMNQSGSNEQGASSTSSNQSSQNNQTSGSQYQAQPGQISNGNCIKEGFVDNQQDCKKFYRCVSNSKGGLVKYEFKCPDNTVWDQSVLACNYPYSVVGKCYVAQPGLPATMQNGTTSTQESGSLQQAENNQSGSTQNQQGGSNQTGQQQTSSGQTSNQNASEQNQQTSSNSNQSMGSNQTQSSYNPITEKPGELINSQCAQSGFVGDDRNCKKFYRCVQNGQGGFIKYEFNCGDGTVWDQETQACNYPYSVKGKCYSAQLPPVTQNSTNIGSAQEGQGQDSSTTQNQGSNNQGWTNSNTENANQNQQGSNNQNGLETSSNQNGSNQSQQSGSSSSSSSQTGTDQNSSNEVQQSGNNQNESAANQNQQGSSSQTSSSQSQQSVSSGQAGMGQDNSNQSQQGGGSQNESTSSQNQQGSSSQSGSNQNASGSSTEKPGQLDDNKQCIFSGFVGDEQNCNKFYRCVESSKGAYVKYEFTCGSGTVWDQETQACNYPYAVHGKCYVAYPDIMAAGQDSSSANMSQGSSQPGGSNNGQNMLNNQGSTGSQGSQQTTNNQESVSGQGTSQQNQGSQQSQQSGSNQSQQSGAEQAGNNNSESSSNQNQQSQSTGQNGSSQNGTSGSSQNESNQTQTTGPATERPGTLINNNCASGGFVGDEQNCQKFYRCIDNGRGGYIKYEFNCGQGTVWDEGMQACNYPYAVKGKCYMAQPGIASSGPNEGNNGNMQGGSQNQNQNQGQNQNNNQGQNQNSNQQGNQNTNQNSNGSQTQNQNNNVGQNQSNNNNGSTNSGGSAQNQAGNQQETSQQNQQPQNGSNNNNQQNGSDGSQSSLPSTQGELINNQCSRPGYVSDQQDCKKFYRCVDNGSSGYIKYEYSCANGTVWDQSIISCNHEFLVSGNCYRPAEPDTVQPQTPNQQPSNNPGGSISNQNQQGTSGDNQSQSGGLGGSNQSQSGESSGSDQSQSGGSAGSSQNQSGGMSGSSESQSGVPTETSQNQSGEMGGSGQSQSSGSTGTSQNQSGGMGGSGGSQSGETTGSNQNQSGELGGSSQNQSGGSTETDQNQSGGTTGSQQTSSGQNESGGTFASPATEKPGQIINDQCASSGFVADEKNCKKFYRCVENGRGGYSKYEFNCGEGTVWDENSQACNYPSAVKGKCYKAQAGMQPSGSSGSDLSGGSQTTEGQESQNQNGNHVGSSNADANQSEGRPNQQVPNNQQVGPSQNQQQNENKSPGSSTTQNGTSGNCNNQTSSNQVFPGQILNNECIKEGFVADEQNCAKFYRCVNNGQGSLSKNEFTCGTGTVWDQTIFSCNYPTAAQGKCSQVILQPPTAGSVDGSLPTPTNENLNTGSSAPASSSQVSEASSSSGGSSPSSPVSGPSCMQDGFLGHVQNCSKFYRCVANARGNYDRHEFSCGKGTVWDQQSLTCNYPWAVQGACRSESPVVDMSSSGPNSTTSGGATQSPSLTTIAVQPTTEPSTSISTVLPTLGSTLPTVTTQIPSESTSSPDGTTQGASQMEPCPIGQLEGDQIALVCPTGFRRHPKYCNLFYQCTANGNSHDYKILVLSCPQGTIYDDKKIQCLPQNETSQTCTGHIAEASLYRKLDINAISPIQVPTRKTLCPFEGSHEMEPTMECSQQFVKCQRNTRRMEGFLYQCPEGFAYWQISRQCERTLKLLHCTGYNLQRSKWQIPTETINVSYRRRKDLTLPL